MNYLIAVTKIYPKSFRVHCLKWIKKILREILLFVSQKWEFRIFFHLMVRDWAWLEFWVGFWFKHVRDHEKITKIHKNGRFFMKKITPEWNRHFVIFFGTDGLSFPKKITPEKFGRDFFSNHAHAYFGLKQNPNLVFFSFFCK